MSDFEFDFDNLPPPDERPKPHPPGKANLSIKEIVENVSSSGLAYLSLTLENIETNKMVWDILMLQGHTADTTLTIWNRVKSFLESIGYEIPKGKFKVNWSELVGKVFTADVVNKQENYLPEGETEVKNVIKARVNWFSVREYKPEGNENIEVPHFNVKDGEAPF